MIKYEIDRDQIDSRNSEYWGNPLKRKPSKTKCCGVFMLSNEDKHAIWLKCKLCGKVITVLEKFRKE